jgi:shikimate kinase
LRFALAGKVTMQTSRQDVKAPADRRASPVRAVVLVGFMGAGKTSVGRELGQRWGWPFVDLDDRVQAREQRTIAEIFRLSGEAKFRRAEHEALRELLKEIERERLVIAVGGGAFSRPENASLLEDSLTTTIFLDASADELWKRCCDDRTERPLRRDETEFRQLYESRRPRYLEAKLHIDTAGKAVSRVASEIERSLGLKEQSSDEEK